MEYGTFTFTCCFLALFGCNISEDFVAVNDVLQAKEAGEMDQAHMTQTVTACLVENIPGMIQEMKGAHAETT